MKTKILDCTLRDGGYVNDWDFGRSCIQYIMQRLLKANIDIIEVGFINENRIFDSNRTIFPDTNSLNTVFETFQKKETEFWGMIDYGTCSIDRIQVCEKTCLDGIRVIFKKDNMHNAIAFGKQLKDKGYLVGLQLVSVTSYTDKDILEFCEEVNKIRPHIVGIVDTYGLMHKERAKHYFELLDYNLDTDIAIGYHSHNNFQLAYSNSIELLEMNKRRNIILDGTLYGMGKSAGNAPTELLVMHLNENSEKKYDIDQILEAIDACIKPIYEKKKWGYNLLYYLSASNDCHPSYVEYLLSKKTLSVKAVNIIVSKISPEKKLKFDNSYIEKLYRDYQVMEINDEMSFDELKMKYKGKDILLLAPGKSIDSEKEKIQNYIINNKPIVIAVNFIPEDYKIDGIFVGNSKRYGALTYQIEKMNNAIDIVITSNISTMEKEKLFIVNIDRLLDEKENIRDISTAMVLNLLVMMNANSITMAGFDGYSDNMENSYCSECLIMNQDNNYCEKINKEMAQKIYEMKKIINIRFLTYSRYEEIR